MSRLAWRHGAARRMTGSALQALDVLVEVFSELRGGVRGGEWGRDRPGAARRSGFLLRLFFKKRYDYRVESLICQGGRAADL